MSQKQDRVTHLSAGDLRNEDAVFKICPTIGLTFGKFHCIDSYVEMTMPANAESQKPPKRASTECCFVASFPTKDEFSEAGDSGTWVMGRDVVLLGMIWGRSGAGSCYVTSIAEILRDIQVNLPFNAALF